MRLIPFVVLTGLGPGSGCGGGGSGPQDAAPVDGGATDAAGSPRFDAAGPENGGDASTDGGLPLDAAGCADFPEVPPSLLPRCTFETRSCIDSCRALPRDGQMTCMSECIASDRMPATAGLDCNACMVAQLVACWKRSGCAEQTGTFFCCLDACEGTDLECASGECNGEATTLAACIPDACTYYESPITTVCLADEGE